MPRPPLPHSSPVQLLEGLRTLQPGLPLGLQERNGLADMLQRLLRTPGPDHPAMAANLALLAFQQWPFDPLWSAMLDDLHRALAFLPPALEALTGRLAATMARPDPVEGYDDLLASEESRAVLKHLPALVADPAEGLFRLGRSWNWLLRLGRAGEPRALAERAALGPEAEPLRQRLLAQWAFYYDAPQAALERLEALDPALWSPWRDILAAELESRLGLDQGGAERLKPLWPGLGWHPHLALLLHDRLFPPPSTVPDSALEQTAVLLYSWNKPDLLAQTLDSLAASDMGPARVAVLDNGSDRGSDGRRDDPMGRTLERARELFGQRCVTVRLPVNVGAPAARNWLLSLPELAGAEHLAFLDDDVLLPQGWLRRLLAQALELGTYGAVGCRIISATAPDCLQSADYHLIPTQPGQGAFQDWPEKLAVLDNTASDLDVGLFGYSRPAGSVSGCCHLLSRAGVERVGGFNLAFSPTQFDDLERDLRLGLAGLPVHYCGDLAIRHVQHSSLARSRTLAQTAQVMGNKIKLEGMFDEEQVRTLFLADLDRLWADLLTKARRVEKALP